MAKTCMRLLTAPTTAEKADWDQFVTASPHGTIFSTCRYLDALGARYSLASFEAGGVRVGGCVLSRNVLGRHANALYCKHLGPILAAGVLTGNAAHKFAREVRLLGEMAELLRSIQRGFDYRFAPSIRYLAPFHWQGFRQETHYTSIIRCTGDDDWRGNSSKQLRYELRQAERGTARIQQIETTPDWNVLHKVAMSPYTQRGAPAPLSLERLAALHNALAPHGQASLWQVEDQDRVTNMALCVQDSSRCYFLINGSTHDAAPYMNKAMIAHLIDHSLMMGRDFDFEGSMLPRIARAYREFTPDFDSYSRIWRPGFAHAIHHSALGVARKILRYG